MAGKQYRFRPLTECARCHKGTEMGRHFFTMDTGEEVSDGVLCDACLASWEGWLANAPL